MASTMMLAEAKAASLPNFGRISPLPNVGPIRERLHRLASPRMSTLSKKKTTFKKYLVLSYSKKFAYWREVGLASGGEVRQRSGGRSLMEYPETTVIRDGMKIDWDVPIEMDDGVVLRCDVYRPIEDGKYPVIITYGPYGKGLHFEDLYTEQWRRMCEMHPDVPAGSTNKYQNWEVVDPEKWVPDGYVCVRVDSRGAGRSPGLLDIWSLREAQDFKICIDWAGVQPWSNGKVGINGISYYAMNAWKTASLQPKHLAAICTWEG